MACLSSSSTWVARAVQPRAYAVTTRWVRPRPLPAPHDIETADLVFVAIHAPKRQEERECEGRERLGAAVFQKRQKGLPEALPHSHSHGPLRRGSPADVSDPKAFRARA